MYRSVVVETLLKSTVLISDAWNAVWDSVITLSSVTKDVVMIAAFLKIITQPRSKGLVHVENLDLFAVLIDIAMSVAKLLAAKFIKSVQNRIAIKLQV